jgi:AcrR family transcriptional regulator
MSVLPPLAPPHARRDGSRRRVRARRRTYLRAEDRREQILKTAKLVFSARGYRLANVSDICRAAGIGRGTLYQYFPNKEAVLLAVMQQIADRVQAVLEGRERIALMRGLARVPVPVILAFCKKRLRQVLDAVFVDEATLRLILREARGLDNAVDRVIAVIDTLVIRALEDDLRSAQRAGVLRRGDVALWARYIVGGIEKLVLDALASASEEAPVNLDAIVDAAVELELFGLLTDEVRT